MCLEFKKQKAKNDWFNCTVKCIKQCTRGVFIRGWNKKRLMCLKFFKYQGRCMVGNLPG